MEKSVATPSKSFVVFIWTLAILGFLLFINAMLPQTAQAAPGDLKYSRTFKAGMIVYFNRPGIQAANIPRTKGGYIHQREFNQLKRLDTGILTWIGDIDGSPAVMIRTCDGMSDKVMPIAEIKEAQSLIFIDWDNDWNRPVRQDLKGFYKKYRK